MNSTRYIVWNLRTGDTRTLKTRPKQEKVEAEEVVFEASLEPVRYSQDTEEETEDSGDADTSGSEEEEAEDVVLGEDDTGEEE